jgi:hypothetical protein
VDKVCGIVKKQLALAEDAQVSGASKFSELGADSLDTVILPSMSTFFTDHASTVSNHEHVALMGSKATVQFFVKICVCLCQSLLLPCFV